MRNPGAEVGVAGAGLRDLAVDLFVRRVRDHREIVGAGIEAAGARALADDADDGEFVTADADLLADRIHVREEGLVRRLPEHDDLAAVFDVVGR